MFSVSNHIHANDLKVGKVGTYVQIERKKNMQMKPDRLTDKDTYIYKISHFRHIRRRLAAARTQDMHPIQG